MDEKKRRAGLYMITKGTWPGLSIVVVPWGVSASICKCDVVNSLYFLLKEIGTFLETDDKVIGAECKGLVGRTNEAESKS